MYLYGLYIPEFNIIILVNPTYDVIHFLTTAVREMGLIQNLELHHEPVPTSFINRQVLQFQGHQGP